MNMAELTTLPLTERLQAMEVLWDSLCRDDSYNPSPVWHADVLSTRVIEIKSGASVDWAAAKSQILASASQLKNRV
jgi:hypothetical protein